MLEKNLIDELFRCFPEKTKENPTGIFKYDKSGHIASFENGSRIYFSYVANLSDARSYTGAEIDYLGIDELTQHEKETIDHLISCMRSPLGYPFKFRGTTNPGGRLVPQ
jgi:phage terminase large subunit